MDELIEFIDEDDRLEFIISLDYSSNENDLYSCSEWADLYSELGDYGNNPLILDTDPDYYIWNMFAGNTYSAYAFLDHNMVFIYKFDMPNLYSFQYFIKKDKALLLSLILELEVVTECIEISFLKKPISLFGLNILL